LRDKKGFTDAPEIAKSAETFSNFERVSALFAASAAD